MSAAHSRRVFVIWLVAAAFSLSLIGLFATPVRAATIVVNTIVDEYDIEPNSTCSLREAIISANTDAAFGGCTAGSGADVITVPAGTYTLTLVGAGEDASVTGDLDITSSVTINGAGAGSTIIDGNLTDRVFHLRTGATSVAISGLTIRNGTVTGSGGGLWASAGSSEVPATVTLTGVAVTGNASTQGGGILNASWTTMTITNSTISGNTAAGGGGGIWSSSFSRLAMTNSTISGNVAATEGGGLRGGVFTASDTFSFVNVTITNNSAATGGGVYIDNVSGTASFKNSIVANQLLGANCASTAETAGPSSAGNNLSSDASCAFGASGDLNSTNPQLGALANNGGQTQTHALLVGSPAIDAGNNTGCPTTDQRANARPVDGDGNGTATCDIGAFEAAAPPTVSITDVTVTEGNAALVDAVFTVTLSGASSGTVTVSYATANGTATAPADYVAESGTVTFAPGDVSETITVTVNGDGLDEPNETFVVNLSAPSGATISDAQGTGTILDDDGPPALSINDVSVTEGNSGTVNATFTVRLLPASGNTVTVAYATANGTATTPADYESTSGTLTFAAGDTEETITVRVVGDTVDEVNETFVVNLSAASGATISDTQGTGTILDDDAAAGALPDTATGGISGLRDGLSLLVLLAAPATALVASRRRSAPSRTS